MTLMPSGFWSYARSDDEASSGHVARLARQLSNEFYLLTGENLDLFLDRETLQWGEEWQKKIDTSIHGTTFFIPIITPAYLKSQACRNEFLSFWRKSRTSGLSELLLPIVYAPVPLDENSTDEVLGIVSRIQLERWDALRLEDENSSVYKKAVYALAGRLKDIAEAVDRKPEVVLDARGDGFGGVNRDDDSSDGLYDRLFEIEEQLPRWEEAFLSLNSAMNEFQAATSESEPDLAAAKRSSKLAPRIVAFKRVASMLEEPTLKFYSASEDLKNIAVSMDSGFGAIAEMVELSSDDDLSELTELLETMNGFRGQIQEIIAEMDAQQGVIKKVGRLSRDMKPAIGRILDGFQMVRDIEPVVGGWISRISSEDKLVEFWRNRAEVEV